MDTNRLSQSTPSRRSAGLTGDGPTKNKAPQNTTNKVNSFQHLHSASTRRRYQHVKSKIAPYIAEMESQRVASEMRLLEQHYETPPPCEKPEMTAAEYFAVVKEMQERIDELEWQKECLHNIVDQASMENSTTKREMDLLRYTLWKSQRHLNELMCEEGRGSFVEFPHAYTKPFWQFVLEARRQGGDLDDSAEYSESSENLSSSDSNVQSNGGSTSVGTASLTKSDEDGSDDEEEGTPQRRIKAWLKRNSEQVDESPKVEIPTGAVALEESNEAVQPDAEKIKKPKKKFWRSVFKRCSKANQED